MRADVARTARKLKKDYRAAEKHLRRAKAAKSSAESAQDTACAKKTDDDDDDFG